MEKLSTKQIVTDVKAITHCVESRHGVGAYDLYFSLMY